MENSDEQNPREPINSPHDKLFKQIVADPDMVVELLQNYLPSQFVATADWSSLTLQNASFIDEHLSSSHADALLTVRCAGTPVHIFILIEHTSTFMPMKPLDMLGYQVNIWKWERNSPNRPAELHNKVSPIVTLLVHQGPTRWAGPVQFHELVAFPNGEREDLGSFQPYFQFQLLDLAATKPEDVRGPMFVSSLLRLMKAAREGTLENWIKQEIVTLIDRLSAEGKLGFINVVGMYIVSVESRIDFCP